LMIVVALLAQPLTAQIEGDITEIATKTDDDRFVFALSKEGMKFEKFVQLASQLTGKAFVYDVRRIQNKTINMVGKKVLKKEDIVSFLQVLFYSHDMAIVPVGPPETEVLMIEDVKTSQSLKQRAVFVSVDELEKRRRRVGEIIATTIRLRYIPVDKAQRALNNILQDHRAGFVHPIEESNSLLVANFAPTVWAIYQMIQAMDVPVPENELFFEQLALEYHVAEDLAPIIENLIEVRTEINSSGGSRTSAASRTRRPATSGGTQTPAPRIIADPRNNTLLVYAVDEYMTEIKRLVQMLDTEVTESVSNIHYYELKNTNAEDIQDVLTDLLSNTGAQGTRATGAGGSRNTRTNGRNNTAAASNPDAVNIVADTNTNSLLITATRARFEEISEIIAKLDKRRPQVLVQAAIAELSDNDLENIGVEIAQVENGSKGVFGVSNFGLSNIENSQGADVPLDTLGDLVRVPNLDAQGLVTGVFTNFIEVPLLVQLFKQTIKGNLVSVPSILVNDNQAAHIIVGDEIPTTTTNQGQFSDQTAFQNYQEANLELSISPTISNDNYLRLNIFLSIQAFVGVQSSTNVPPQRSTREIETNITVQSGRTVVIGGLTTDNLTETVQGIPLLADIPILGYLFRNSGVQHQKTTLYVFITPTILNDFNELERISYERKLEIAKLDGQVKIIDPNFRKMEIDDEKLDIEAIEASGHLDLPQYKPTMAPTEPVNGAQPDSIPVKPNADPKAVDGDPEMESGKEGAKAVDVPVGADLFSAPLPEISTATAKANESKTKTATATDAKGKVGKRQAGAKPKPATTGGL
jgi:general secretion pathway protein D